MKPAVCVLTVLVSLMLAGCEATPMTYDQWKKEQDEKLAYKRAGVEYKSPEQLKAEAAGMKKDSEGTTFSQDPKK